MWLLRRRGGLFVPVTASRGDRFPSILQVGRLHPHFFFCVLVLQRRGCISHRPRRTMLRNCHRERESDGEKPIAREHTHSIIIGTVYPWTKLSTPESDNCTRRWLLICIGQKTRRRRLRDLRRATRLWRRYFIFPSDAGNNLITYLKGGGGKKF